MRWVWTAGLVASAAVGALWVARTRVQPPAPPASAPVTAVADSSNIRAADYVGPAVCGECHPDKYASWRESLHARMNQRAGDAGAIVGDFSGTVHRYAGGTATFDRVGDDYTMTLARDGEAARRYRITRTIGVRHLQEYVGVLAQGPEPPEHPLYHTEIRLPFGYWRRPERWLHQQYFDSWYGPEFDDQGTPTQDPYAPNATPWAARCAWCHNTYAFELRAQRSDARGVGEGLEAYVSFAQARPATDLLDDADLVTVGISCESCHLGGRAHAIDGADIRFVPTSDALVARPNAPSLAGGRHNALVINTICAQCHSTPANRYPDGGVTRNSSEALDMAAGACMSRIACVDCHDPHTKGSRVDAPCAGCHADLAPGHSGHRPTDATCMDCHMPRVVQGISHVVRTHRISSPTSPAMYVAGAPTACNLCHLDETLDWTLDALATLWNVQLELPDDVLRDVPVGASWLAGADRNARIAAAAAFGRRRQTRDLPGLFAALDDPVAYNRMWILFAIEDAIGRPLTADEYDPVTRRGLRAP